MLYYRSNPLRCPGGKNRGNLLAQFQPPPPEESGKYHDLSLNGDEQSLDRSALLLCKMLRQLLSRRGKVDCCSVAVSYSLPKDKFAGAIIIVQYVRPHRFDSVIAREP